MAPSDPAKAKKLVQTKLTWSTTSQNTSSTHDRNLAFQRPSPDDNLDDDQDAGSPMEVDSQATTVSWASSNYSMDLDDLVDDSAASNQRSSISLAIVASETRNVLPSILKSLPSAPPHGRLYDSMHELHQHRNPRLPPTTVRVLNADTLDVALSMLVKQPVNTGNSRPPKPPLILNMANSKVGGGGWLAGARAQEEALCYRSSLSFTLKRRFYPIPELAAIYSPTVVVIRDSMAVGHKLMDFSDPSVLPVVSAVSVAAIRMPPLVTNQSGELIYAKERDRRLMKEKMKVVLRVAGMEYHRKLVLGALGCGAFGNPSEEVAKMWREVLQDGEWSGWFEDIVFAVLDMGSGNWSIFDKELGGLTV